jgi:hypothetical protein
MLVGGGANSTRGLRGACADLSVPTRAAGWSSGSSTSSCITVSVGTACQLALSYAPTVADSGTLTLAFSYTNNSGTAKTGMLSIPYTATVPPPPGP